MMAVASVACAPEMLEKNNKKNPLFILV